MPTQTPASRKFVPPSSTSTARTSDRPGFSTRFVQSSQTPSSPFPRTPFSSAGVKPGKFDIDADDFEDCAEVDGHAFKQTVSRVPHQDIIANDPNQDDDLLPDVNCKGRRADAPSRNLTQRTPSLPPSTAKRRKLSHFVTEVDSIDKDEGIIDSSPPLPQLAYNNTEGDDGIQVQIPRSSPVAPPRDEQYHPRQHQTSRHDSSHSPPSDNSPAKPITTPKLKTSRFRHPPLAHSAIPRTHNSIDQPYPSFQSRLLGGSTSAYSLRGPAPSLDFTLPDAFSPSRKKGQRGYVHRGHAETVRGWVLDVAARAGDGGVQGSDESGGQMDEGGLKAKPFNGLRSEDPRIIVGMVLCRDPDGRFAVVRLVRSGYGTAQSRTETKRNHCDGEVWMLINTDSQTSTRRNTPTGKLEMLQPGVAITIKGGEAVRWSLDFNSTFAASNFSSSRHAGTMPLVGLSPEQVKDDSRCSVAVLWDVVQ